MTRQQKIRPREKKPRKGPRINNKRAWKKMLSGRSHLGRPNVNR